MPSHIIILQVAEHICLIILDELLFQQFLEIATVGGVHRTAEALADNILNGKLAQFYHSAIYTCMHIIGLFQNSYLKDF